MQISKKGWLLILIAAGLAAGGYAIWEDLTAQKLPEGIASGNGRIEATEIDIAAKTAGRIAEILVSEGEFVDEGQVLVKMDTKQLLAQKRQAEAELHRAEIGIDTANSLVTQREAERRAAEAVVAQRHSQLDAAEKKLARTRHLVRTDAVSQQVLDDDEASESQARATLAAAEASQAASQAGISAAKAQVVDAGAAVDAAKAALDYIETQIADSTLEAPRTGRVQYLVAQPGEIVSGGGRVLNLVDLADVYMTVFLPTAEAGRLAIGSEARIVLDAAPDYVIPARITYVADVAQFTPKSVETAEERQKLMFRVKARIDPDLLKRYIRVVKTGLPGMAYVKADPEASWPAWLDEKLVK
ncbi:HlyD family secretion protein [Breoghania corrubedonensis]|uniref:HlyD family secretion protein n=1 Tax=Breoghania corrubedonensis TaxID=665038 RepID=A0A2T5V7S5_9HYPH|nr:HlyD family efflux transporter periplasmic adaptor subunit [Breoghania corrubedonensis]PTW59807.1 HlyD family secretion protein [Breoghania corrubedonensis]